MRQQKIFYMCILFIAFFTSTKAKTKKKYSDDTWRKKAFTWIYDHHHWCQKDGDPISGEGSTLGSTETLRAILPTIVKVLKIKTILDAGCGDFTWMQTLELDIEKYTGFDIVDKLIEINKSKYENEKYSFFCKDIVKEKLPKVDLIICRDCLAHLSNQEIVAILKNCKKSGSQYLLASTFPKVKINTQMKAGNFRGVNLCAYPFSLPRPLIFFEEISAEKDMRRWGKCMAIWKLQELDI